MIYTHATWRVRDGSVDAFLEAWDELARAFSALPAPPVGRGTLIRSEAEPLLFHSFGPWRSMEDVAAMRADARAQAALERARALCVEATPGAYALVRDVEARPAPEFRVFYPADRYDETVAFHRDVLGFEVFRAWDRGADRGTLLRAPNGGLIEIQAGTAPGSARVGCYIEVDEVDAWHARLRDAGAPITEAPRVTGYGHRNFRTVDPSGVEYAFFAYVTRPDPYAPR